MNILHKLRQALINAGWIRGVEVREPLTDEWRDTLIPALSAAVRIQVEGQQALSFHKGGVNYRGVPVVQVDSLPSQKAIDLANIAFQRDRLKDQLAHAKRLKLRRRHIYAALAELTEAELRIEGGK